MSIVTYIHMDFASALAEIRSGMIFFSLPLFVDQYSTLHEGDNAHLYIYPSAYMVSLFLFLLHNKWSSPLFHYRILALYQITFVLIKHIHNSSEYGLVQGVQHNNSSLDVLSSCNYLFGPSCPRCPP